MIAKCKMCQVLITPDTILNVKPSVLAKIPPEELESVRFGAAVTHHLQTAHPEYMQMVEQMGRTFAGHCTLSTVDPVGMNSHTFVVRRAADEELLRMFWDALPNRPDPAKVQELARVVDEQLTKAAALDAQHAAGRATEPGDFPAPGGGFVPTPPGVIKLT